MESSVVIALVVFFIAFAVFMTVLPKLLRSGEDEHTKHALRKIMEETRSNHLHTESMADGVFRNDMAESGALRAATRLPGGFWLASSILKAGLGHNAGAFLLAIPAIFLLAALAAAQMHAGPVGYILALVLAYFLPVRYLEARIRKRNDRFIDMFPDVLDMIVRSVRSGFPINAAIQMVAKNMDPPISTEFQQVADEVALGQTLSEALSRLAGRIEEPDINFFVVVLSVQQETGGNLAEVIGNLSSVIRKRKLLRMKIKAMTSEGRTTGWILGALPVVVFGVLWFMSPHHLDPLFTTETGNIMLITVGGLLALTFWIVQQMLDVDI